MPLKRALDIYFHTLLSELREAKTITGLKIGKNVKYAKCEGPLW